MKFSCTKHFTGPYSWETFVFLCSASPAMPLQNAEKCTEYHDIHVQWTYLEMDIVHVQISNINLYLEHKHVKYMSRTHDKSVQLWNNQYVSYAVFSLAGTMHLAALCSKQSNIMCYNPKVNKSTYVLICNSNMTFLNETTIIAVFILKISNSLFLFFKCFWRIDTFNQQMLKNDTNIKVQQTDTAWRKRKM